MATERQIQANRLNAARSTGPTSRAGKAKSRANATKHGLAGESAAVEAGTSAEFEERRARWAAEREPVGQAAGWALDRAVAASLRIERCERSLENLTAASRERARLAWDQDRAVEAATIAGRLARDPVLASRQLQASLAGVELLVEAWLGLVAALGAGGDWSESQASRALDLLGVAADLRSGRTPIDGPEGGDPVAFRRGLALEEVDRLEALGEEALAPLDEMDRRHALAGDVALLSRPAKLVLRYERDAWRRFRESMRQVEAGAQAVAPPSPPVVAPPPRAVAPASAVASRPEARERAVARPSPSLEGELRALLAEVAPIRGEVTDRLVSMGLGDQVAWLDELERRIDAMPEPAARGRSLPLAEGPRVSGGRVGPAPARLLATERTRFGEIPVDPSPSYVAGR